MAVTVSAPVNSFPNEVEVIIMGTNATTFIFQNTKYTTEAFENSYCTQIK